MTGYTRQSTITPGNPVYASDFNNEFNTIEGAFNGTTGHAHDGTTGNAPQIGLTTSVTGVLPIANGGTNANSAANARTSLGLAIGTNVQAYDAGLLSIAGLTTGSDTMIYTTALDVYSTTALTPFARTILDDANAAAVLTTIGAQPVDATLTSLAAYNTNGIVTQTAADTFTGRTITGTANEITLTNGSGVSGNPTISIPSAVTFTGKTITGGTFSTPTINTPALVLAQSTTPTPTAEGNIQWDTDDDAIVVGNGTGQKIFRANDWEKISAVDLAGLSSLNITNLSAYRHLRIQSSFVPSTDGTSLTLLLSNNNGSSWINGSSDYYNMYVGHISSLASVLNAGAGSNGFYYIIYNASNTIGGACNLTLYDFNQSSTKWLDGTMGYNSGGITVGYKITGQRNTSAIQAACNAVRIIPTAGTVGTGFLSIEGLRV